MHLNEEYIAALLSDDAFLDWVKYPTPEKTAYWDDFFSKNEDKRLAATEARKLIEEVLDSSQEEPARYSRIKHRLFLQIQEAEIEKNQRGIIGLWDRAWIKVAAVLTVFLGLGWLYYTVNRIDSQYQENLAEVKTKTEWVEQLNTSPQTQLVLLPDGSSVILQPKSKISFPKRFTEARREVVLSGEAFFEVEKNPKQPFFVHANELVTKVLGTSFVIKAFSTQRHIEVVVKTGKVAVCASDDEQIEQFKHENSLVGMVLVQNEKADYDRDETLLKRIKEQTNSSTTWTKVNQRGIFDFQDTPVRKVFATIEDAYDVDIVVDDELVKNCSLTAFLGTQHLFEKINIICSAIQARYEVIDGKIVIYAQKCH